MHIYIYIYIAYTYTQHAQVDALYSWNIHPQPVTCDNMAFLAETITE